MPLKRGRKRSEIDTISSATPLHARIQNDLSERSNPDNVFLMRVEATICPSVKRHLNGVSLAGQRWPKIECWLGSFVIFQGIRMNIAKKPYMLVFFSAESGPLAPSGSAHALVEQSDATDMCYLC